MEGKTTVKYLQEYLKQKDCYPERHKDYFLKLAEEVGELIRAERKCLKAKEGQSIKGTLDEGLWDVMYYVLCIANLYDIDMEQVIKEKEALNQRRYPSQVTFEEGK